MTAINAKILIGSLFKLSQLRFAYRVFSVCVWFRKNSILLLLVIEITSNQAMDASDGHTIDLTDLTCPVVITKCSYKNKKIIFRACLPHTSEAGYRTEHVVEVGQHPQQNQWSKYAGVYYCTRYPIKPGWCRASKPAETQNILDYSRSKRLFERYDDLFNKEPDGT